MQDFKAWYHGWILKQELTISRLDIAKAAFEAGVLCAQDKNCEHKIEHKEINTHKGSF